MTRIRVEMESYGMNPETLGAVAESTVLGQMYDHMESGASVSVGFETADYHQTPMGTSMTSVIMTVGVPSLPLSAVRPLVWLALSNISDEHRHGEYEPKPEAFRFAIISEE